MREKPLILVADDDKDYREAVALKFKNAGFDTVIARDGNEARQKAKETKPDFAILDINMPPGPNGIEVALELKESPETSNSRVIFLSGLEDPWPAFKGSKQEVSKELGMEDFFVKTKDLTDLVTRVQAIVREGAPPPPSPSAPPLPPSPSSPPPAP
ncbi:MAG: hypothetical protein A2945_01375 [Candidatus Liptonbacteria bacterium RIFCSPLOWO2_01_FULL_52_25]|uniref:Response regulatory domain-containing protein n=1 Tax=Candidatus Liptonbacteria bacterium RIFCSPLOWO2_01_FULL_52_25 TaxID=1798650 RepID=A0A1G2CE64_9BACT|nr:MAG: hypothetical protein A2945_01375 [Candidatus Liptonbacteria bacterium RIFCSPLOWO2_01_FULL_52_25]